MRTILSLVICFLLTCLLITAMADDFVPLKKGSKGYAVREIQTDLKDKGYLSGKVDGDFGKGTERAVISFQKDSGLPETGIVDEATYQKLHGVDSEIDATNATDDNTAEPETQIAQQKESVRSIRKQQQQRPVVKHDTHYYTGNSCRSKTDSGFSELTLLDGNDLHFGHRLGRFMVSGFTSKATLGDDDNKALFFFKTVGDEIKLSFMLEENIDRLFGNEDLSIGEDEKGYDHYFGVPKTNFGRGTLIVQHTDLSGEVDDPMIYTDYLSGVKRNAETEVLVFEEGLYEVALDYEVDKKALFGPKRYDYCIFFSFYVINGNSMVYAIDAYDTTKELFDGDTTDNGFIVDFAGTQTLDVVVQRDVQAGSGWDTRFNGVIGDGDKFFDPGRYTIDVMNVYTGANTVKTIYVGEDAINSQAYLDSYSDADPTVQETLVPDLEEKVTTGIYYCTACESILDVQFGFDPSVGYWTCTDCGQFLYDGDNENIYQGELFPDVMWYCDNCTAFLNEQKGFTDTKGSWKCTECGYVSEISEAMIIN